MIPKCYFVQLSVETQRLEELAIKQAKQLIPVMPSAPKSLVRHLRDDLPFIVNVL